MTEATASADGGQGAATATTQTTTTTSGAPPVTGPAWLPNADEVTVGYVQNKGWTEPGQMLESYRGLEKLLGADRAGNTVVLPKADSSPEELGKFYEKLGRPTAATEYKVDVPEGAPKEYADGFRNVAFELGLSQKQVEGLAKWNNGFAGAAGEQQKLAAQQRFQADDAALKADWGQAFTQNLGQAQAAARGLGIPPEQIDAMAASLGHKATMELFQKIGSRMGESDFVTGDKLEKFGNALTPGQAKAEIQSLRDDRAFVAKLMSKDAEATAKWTRLHNFAFPEQQG